MSETNRPVLDLPMTILEKILQCVSIAGILFMILAFSLQWSSIPGKIPSHFGASGQPNSWSGRGSLLILPITSLILYAGITLLERFPHVFNYAVEITQDNAEFQYRNARAMMIWLKTDIVLTFTYIEWMMIEAAFGRSKGLGAVFLPVFLVVLFAIMGYHIARMLKYKNPKH